MNVPQQPLIINRTNSNQLQSPELNKVGQSVFYDCVDLSPMGEKQDDMKPERSDTEEESKLKQLHLFGFILFKNIDY